MKRFYRGSAVLLLALLLAAGTLPGALAQETGFTSANGEEAGRVETNGEEAGRVETNGEEAGRVEIYFFWMRGCPYCEHQKDFLDELTGEYPGISLYEYRIIPPEEGASEALYGLAERYGVEITRMVAPMSFVDGEFFVGYNPQTGREIRAIVEAKLGAPSADENGAPSADENGEEVNGNNGEVDENRYLVYLPILGEMNLAGLSLPLLAFLLGSFDGLNVCSIGALLLVLAIVLKFNSRKKILLYGGLFLLVTAIAYGLLVFLWYGVMHYLVGYFDMLSLFIGLAALAGGIHFFRDFLKFYKYGPTCETSSSEFVNKLQRKVQNRLLGENTGIFAMVTAIVLFAVAVTIVELPCSVALPLVFSGVLVDAGLGPMAFGFYVAMYLFFYLLIELVVFGAAVYTKEIWYGPERSITWVTLMASLVMIGIGIYYLYPLIPI